jgi:hypothetical protein
MGVSFGFDLSVRPHGEETVGNMEGLVCMEVLGGIARSTKRPDIMKSDDMQCDR